MGNNETAGDLPPWAKLQKFRNDGSYEKELLYALEAQSLREPRPAPESQPRMFYFGPWDRAGHYLVNESGHGVRDEDRGSFPWHEMGYGGKPHIDGNLQPRGPKKYYSDKGPELPQGVAALHHLNGWTALCFWDRSVDTRGACNSNYFAEGIFTFEQMVEMAKTRFAHRWNKMKFEVTPNP